MKKRVELLAPAGSFEGVLAAVNAGADAVYVGGTRFGARAYADNPDEEGLIKAIHYCHLRGRKIYLTVNTLFKEDELKQGLFEYLLPFYKSGIDAVIVQDTGAMHYIQECFPGLDIHVSTQVSICMAEGINLLKEEFPAITRVVPARELSLQELRTMRENTDAELEVFIHGALCYSYSGQCLLSSFIGGRSGNRGRCAQPCRKCYTAGEFTGFLLSLKDNCQLENIGRMIEAGIDSFKIEGRMKSPEYAAGVVAVYRYFIDKYYELGSKGYDGFIRNSKELERGICTLKELYNRGGFNRGYTDTHNGSEMMCFDRPNHSGIPVGTVVKARGREAVISLDREVSARDVLEIRRETAGASRSFSDFTRDASKVFEWTLGEGYDSGENLSCITMKDRTAHPGDKVYRTRNGELLASIRDRFVNASLKVPIGMRFAAHEGSEAEFTVWIKSSAGITVTVYSGSITARAQKSPSDSETVKKQLLKLGETDFVCTASDAVIDIDDYIFLPVGELNNLRREAVQKLTKAILAEYERNELLENVGSERAGGTLDNAEREVTDEGFDVRVFNLEQLRIVLNYPAVRCVYAEAANFSDCECEEAYKLTTAAENRLYFALPYILRDKDKTAVSSFVERYKGSAGFLVRNYEELAIVRGAGGVKYRTDYNVYAMNSLASSVADRISEGFTVPLELNGSELMKVAAGRSGMIIYGRMPVMISAQCVRKNTCGCGRSAVTEFTDEKGFTFKAVNFCKYCYNVLYNSAVINLTERFEELESIPARREIVFTFEEEEEIREVMDCVSNRQPSAWKNVRYTNGHFTRGVE